jgi:hypothetical protein
VPYFVRVRFAFFVFFSFLLVGVARADGVGSVEAPIVRGEPVQDGPLYGTVALVWSRDGESQEEVEPTSVPARISCSGTLITPTTVLTAGHCVQACADDECRCGEGGCRAVDADRLYVIAGMTDLESVWETELVGVSNIVLHENYVDWQSLEILCDASYCTGLAGDSNDLALLHLASPLTSLRPVPLYPEERLLDLAGERTVALAQGYGFTLPPRSEDLLSEDAYVALLHEGASRIEQSTQNELLTARSDGNAALCYGDSGGPLYVLEGGTALLAGVASRLRGDVPAACEGGGVYAMVPAYTQWIEENARGELPSATYGGGGCSVSRGPGPAEGLVVVFALSMLLSLLRRPGTLAVVALMALGTLGCGSSGDVSFCTEDYDPTGLACGAAEELIDLHTAEARASAEVPADAWLWYAGNSNSGLLNPDGRSHAWAFSYYLASEEDGPPAGRIINLQVSATDTYAFEPFTTEAAAACIPTEAIQLPSSRRLVHDGIRFLEEQGEMVQLIDGGYLELRLAHPCSGYSQYPNYLGYADKLAVFDSKGVFRSLVDRPR